MMENELLSMGESEALALLEQIASCAGPAGPKPAPILGAIVAARGGTADRARDWQPDLRYRTLVEKLPVVTFMASLNDTVQELYVSPQIEALLGFTQDEWLDNPILWFRQLHPDDRDMWVREFARTCSTGERFRAEYRLLARDGHVVWVQGECQLIRDDDGRPLFLQGVAFDITHLKRAAQIEEAKLAAEAANSAKSEFLARMSHEIRTPLNGVVGMIDLLRATGMNESQHRYAQLAREAADSLMTVINDILDFSKIEAGKVEIESIEFDLHKLIEDLTELLAPLAAKKNLALACLLRPDLPHRLLGDPNRIRQVLTNLVNNSLKFTTRGYVSMRAYVQSREGENLVVRVQVEDTGIGIPADRLDRLFKSFSQVDSSTTRKFGGTGLGLAISKRLVELMGGEIGIESTEGKGTTFWFTLKVYAVAASDEAVDAGPAAMLRSVRVLAVESDPRYRRILTEQIDGRLSPTSLVVDAGQALETLRQANAQGKPFTVALLPLNTSETGPLAQAIRSEPALRQTNLIAIMDIDDRTEAAAITQAGYFARLHRPLTQSRLLDVIASATVQRSAGPASSSAPATAMPVSLKGLHVLVAEDNEMNQFVTQQTLSRVECTCDIVADGALAVEAVKQKRYDAVLMDCQMPGMDGLEAARRIREFETASGAARRVPIIALTAEAIQGDREKCLAAGMDGYVTKPINAPDLFAAIGFVVRNVASGSAAPIPAPPAAAPAPALDAVPQDVPIDVEALLGRCMRDADFATRTLEKFQHRALEDVELLRCGVAAKDVAGTTRLAHNLKAVAAHVAAAPLRKIAFEIEQAGIRRDLAFIEQQLTRLDAEARRCAQYIPEAIDRLARLTKSAA